jgi:hypothetical protein
MKKAILMCAAAMTLLLVSCKSNSDEKTTGTEADSTNVTTETAVEPEVKAEASVVGTWKLTDVDLEMEVPKGKEKQFEDMKKKMFAETNFTFNEDGTMSGDNPAVKGTTGTYTYADSKLDITDSKTKNVETLNVDELTADKLVISSKPNGRKAVMTFSKK